MRVASFVLRIARRRPSADGLETLVDGEREGGDRRVSRTRCSLQGVRVCLIEAPVHDEASTTVCDNRTRVNRERGPHTELDVLTGSVTAATDPDRAVCLRRGGRNDERGRRRTAALLSPGTRAAAARGLRCRRKREGSHEKCDGDKRSECGT